MVVVKETDQMFLSEGLESSKLFIMHHEVHIGNNIGNGATLVKKE